MGFPTETTGATQEDIRLLNNRIRQNETIIEEINKWRWAHAGIDATSAGPEYPHPSFAVRVLRFANGLGRLNANGLVFNSSDQGMWWYVNEPPEVGTAAQYPRSKVTGTATADETNVAIEASYASNKKAFIDVYSDTSGGLVNLQVTHAAGVPSGKIPVVQLRADGTDYDFRVADLPLLLDGVTADFATLTNGDLWYRSDLGSIRVQLGNVTRNLSDDGDWSTKTIAAGVLTITTSRHKVDTQGGAATDDLDTVTGLNDGGLLILTGVSAARVVTAKDGTGNLKLAGDCPLASPNDTLMLVKQGSNWFEVSRSINS